jgi:hypothetical protein
MVKMVWWLVVSKRRFGERMRIREEWYARAGEASSL